MNIRPLRSLPLRFSLKAETAANALERRFAPLLDAWLAHRASRIELASVNTAEHSLAIRVHPYALIGHQVSSWIAGWLWSRDLVVEFVGGYLPRDENNMFGGESPRQDGDRPATKVIRLPWVEDERSPRSRRILENAIRAAIHRHGDRALTFRLALDPARYDQTPASDAIRQAVLSHYKGKALLEAEAENEYVAIHIRRGGDIHQNHFSGPEQVNRWVTEDWHVLVVEELRQIPELASMEFRAYSLGSAEDFPLLREIGVRLMLNGDRDQDLVELAAARVLVLSPSSFSFTSALMSRGAVLGRVPWRHRIPNDGRWVSFNQPSELNSAVVLKAMSAVSE